MSQERHPLLARQLRKLGLDSSRVPDEHAWAALVKTISATYDEDDQERYTLERSLAISSDEMQALYQRQKSSHEARLRTIFSALNDLIWLKDKNGVYLACNPLFESLVGLSEAELVGKTDAALPDPETAHFLELHARKVVESKKPSTHEHWVTLKRDGHNARKSSKNHQTLLEIVLTPVLDSSGQLTAILGLGRDITERKRAEENIKALTFFDQLTGLPNRTLMQDRITQAMNASARTGYFSALLFIDLDRFKLLNDTMGHDIGDQLLQQVAQRLHACVRESDTVARMGGDEFVITLVNLSQDLTDAITQTQTVGEKILASLNQAYIFGDVTHHSTPSIGATLFKGHQTPLKDLLKRADMAMYQSKEAGRNTLRFFTTP